MIRRLMREILGAENLIKMSPTGRGGHKEIPSVVKSAIFRKTGFINSVVRRDAFRIIITIYQIINMCPVSGKYTIKHDSPLTYQKRIRREVLPRVKNIYESGDYIRARCLPSTHCRYTAHSLWLLRMHWQAEGI